MSVEKDISEPDYTTSLLVKLGFSSRWISSRLYQQGLLRKMQ